MSTDVNEDLAIDDSLTDQRVLIEFEAGDHGLEDGEYVVQVVGPSALIIRPKGKTQPKIAERQIIKSVQLSTDDGSNDLKQSSLKPISTPAALRRHLVNYHGLMLSEVNSATDAQCEARHNDLHRIHGKDLGHNHNKKDEAGDVSDSAENTEPEF